MNPPKLADYFEDVRSAWDSGNAVFVLGPGCDRIDYDEGREWDVVAERVRRLWHALGDDGANRRFLEEFWRDKHTRAGRNRLPMKGPPSAWTLPDPGPEPRDEVLERARIRLAEPLFRVLTSCTAMLGKVVATGEWPVRNWDGVVVPWDHEPSRSDRQDCVDWLKNVQALAEALHAWAQSRGALTDPQRSQLEDPELDFYGIDAGEREAGRVELTDADRQRVTAAEHADRKTGLRILDVAAIAVAARRMREHYLDPDAVGVEPYQLNGAVIEWLGDLVWHVLIADSAVPPSQAEWAFLINLRAGVNGVSTPRTLSRPQHGEYRSGDAAQVSRAVKLRLTYVPSGLGAPPAEDRRHRVAAVLSATLWAQWRNRDAAGHAPIALGSSYGLLLEHYLLKHAEPKEQLHIVVPALINGRHSWLWGTYSIRNKVPNPNGALQHGGGLLTWMRYDDPAMSKPGGPIIIKLNGSPLLKLPDLVYECELIDPAAAQARPKFRNDPIVPLTVFAERDAMRALLALRKSQTGVTHSPQGPAQRVQEALTWDRRSWLLLGDRFPDWIPRLRLLINTDEEALGAQPGLKQGAGTAAGGLQQRGGAVPPGDAALSGSDATAPSADAGAGAASGGPSQPSKAKVVAKIAIDREFDWPERALLEALEVKWLLGDLGELDDVPTRDEGWILEQVASQLGR